MELNINYSHTPNNKDVQQYSIHRKKIYSKLYDEKKAELMDLTELLVFLFKHPNFEKMIKDDDILEEWVNYCERTYSVDIFDYVGSYEDIENLIK